MGLGYGVEVAVRCVVAPWILAARWAFASGGSGAEFPKKRLSLSLAGKVALDELFFATEFVSSSFISLRDRHRISSEVADALRLFEAEGWLDDPRTFHRRPPQLTSPELYSGESNGLRFTHMQFESGYDPHPHEPGAERWRGYEANRTAHAWVLQHPGPPRPWLVCIHGYRMGSPLIDLVAFRALWLHHKRGLNVMLPVLPLHGPRMAGRRSGDGFLTGDFLDTLHVQAQAMWDLRRILGWIRREGAPAIGVYGLSLGGYTTALLAGLEPDLSCVIAGIPATDFVRLACQHIPPGVRWLSEIAGMDWSAISRIMQVVSPLAIEPVVPHDRRYLFAGVADSLVPPEHVLSLWNHWERPRLLWYEGGHVSYCWNTQVKALLREALEESGLTGEAYVYARRAASA